MAPNDDGPAGGAGAGRGNWKLHQPSTGDAAAGPDLRHLHGRTCPSCLEARVRVVESAGLLLLTCGRGCPGRDIERAAQLAARPEGGEVPHVDGRVFLTPSPELCPSGKVDHVDRARPEVLTVSTCSTQRTTGQDGPRQAREAAPALLDPFDRYLLTLAYGRKLLPAAEALTVAALDSSAPAEGLLARQALAALAPVVGLRAWPWYDDKPEQPAPAPLERVAADVAAVLVEGVLAASPGRRGEAAGLLRAVARFGARGPAAAPARAAA